ncbi:MAG: DUF624 domain-containing protein [Clostridiales bacterium]|nr:DUF624 domain-containing protein [Clostridiales bacterium]
MSWWRRIFSYEGTLIQVLEKIGKVIVDNIMFLVCCIPLVTIGASLTSFYYAMIKSVRRERGNLIREFFSSMKRIIGKGCIFTLEIAAVAVVLLFGLRYSIARESQQLTFLYLILLALFGMVSIYVFPVLSRFTLSHKDIWKLAFIMCFKHFLTTIIIAAGSVLIGYLVIFRLPIACILVAPGAWCYVITFLMEKVLLKYMPPPSEEDSGEWYYEKTGWQKWKEAKKGARHEKK